MVRSLRIACIAVLFAVPPLCAQTSSTAAQPTAPQYTVRVQSRIVFLDITVLDKQNRPVTSGLTKDDFAITEEHKPQQISSFEAPDAHTITSTAPEDSSPGAAPLTEFVLDRLNSTFEQFAYSTVCLRRYLASQPPQLSSPTELMLLDNSSFDLIHAYTRDRDELIDALDHISAALPMKLNGAFFNERVVQSISALREIALRNQGLPGRKNVLWIGTGIGINTSYLPDAYKKLKWFSHDTTNALVDGRISLFVIYPGTSPARLTLGDVFDDGAHHLAGLNRDDPFAGDVGFGAFAYETGGAVLHTNSWIDLSMKSAESYGRDFYTLTYRPPDGPPDGRFRRIAVTLRDPHLHAMTKIGYYAPDSGAPFSQKQQQLFRIASEVQSALPFDALEVSVAGIIRHSDSGTVELTLHLSPKNVDWQSEAEGKSRAELVLNAVSLGRRRDVLAARFQDLAFTANTQDPRQLAATSTLVRMTLHTPRKTEVVRVVLETQEHGRAGSVEIPAPQSKPRTMPPHPRPSSSLSPSGRRLSPASEQRTRPAPHGLKTATLGARRIVPSTQTIALSHPSDKL